MKNWIKELCPEIADWQCELIADEVDKAVAREREACARVCEDIERNKWQALIGGGCAGAIRARGEA